MGLNRYRGEHKHRTSSTKLAYVRITATFAGSICKRCIVTVIATCANTVAHTRTPHLQRLLEDALCAQQVAVHTPCQLGEAVQRRHKLVVVRQSTSEEDLRR